MDFDRKVKLINFILSQDYQTSFDNKLFKLSLLDTYLDEIKFNPKFKIPSDFMEIYDELGLISDKDNYYITFLNELEKIYKLNCNILEIGGGSIPSLAKRIAKKQINIGSGTITVYDEELAFFKHNYSNLKLQKENLTEKSNIESYDLVISLFPCTATFLTVYKALEYNKDFFIGLCDCIHPIYGESDSDYEYDLAHPLEYQEKMLDEYKYMTKYYSRKLKIIDTLHDFKIITSKKGIK